MNIGSVIRDLRVKAGLTQGELGARAGVTDSAICQIERGRTKDPRLSLIAKLLHVLKAPPGYAFKQAGLPAHLDNPGGLVPPLVEINEIINGIPEGPKRDKVESLLLETARAWRDYDD